MAETAVDPTEIETRRRQRADRLAAVELPLLRVVGSALLALGVYLNNRFLVPSAPADGWIRTAIVLGVWAAVAWALVVYFIRRPRRRDLTPHVLFGDLVVWTMAIYYSGAEASWLFFILLLRVADQTQTTFRRALSFAIVATACYAGMLGWVVFVDHRPIDTPAALTKFAFILLSGIYVSLAAITAQSRRAQLTSAIRMSRDLIHRLEEQSIELREAQRHAEEANAAKSDFVANMSHEMRTPLQGVIGTLSIAIEDEGDAQRIRRLETARRSAETLLSMIDDILDFARIEARRLELEPVYFPLRQAMSDTMKSLGVIAASKRLTLSYFVQPDLPETVWGDPLRLRQVLVNLVGNAIKFTHQGEIAVHVSRGGEKVRFDVRDTGIGIAPALRKRIFDPFTQADSSHSRRYGGAGLGLSIVARLIEVMGGTVDVESEQGTGSVFSFLIPLEADAIGAAPQRQPWESSLAGRSIVIVEPAEMARTAIADILRSRGVFASAFVNAAQVPAGRFACAITADPAVTIRPQVIIASPNEPPAPLQVTRPVGERELIEAIGVALGLTTETVEYSLVPEVRVIEPKRVLLVEDNEVNREVVGELLRRLGHIVTFAADGEEAVNRIERGAFDVVFMDVQLPRVDGLEATRRVRAMGRRTPIIALTAHSSRSDRDRCLTAGMNSVLVKPVTRAQLAEAIGAASEVSAAETAESLLEVVGGNAELLARVRDAFARQTPELFAGIRGAIERRDADALARHAHTLKGSLSNFPPERGATLARELESAARAGDVDRAAALLPVLEDTVARLSNDLQRV